MNQSRAANYLLKSSKLKEFVPLSSVDPVYFQHAYYLRADSGGEKAYRLLSEALSITGRAAVAKLLRDGKDHLALIRPYRNGLVLHTLYYAREIKEASRSPRMNFSDISSALTMIQASLDTASYSST